MRCLNLAKHLKKSTNNISFICRDHVGNLNDLIINSGFEVLSLPINVNSNINSSDNKNTDYSNLLGVSQKQDALDTISVIGDSHSDMIIVDHYSLDIYWEKALRKYAKKIMVIDDLANRKHDCDIVLNQNFFLQNSNLYLNKTPKHCVRLLGPKFALLGNEYRLAKQKLSKHRGRVNKVLIYFGSSPDYNLITKVLEIFQNEVLKQIKLDIVIGMNTHEIESIKSFCKIRPNSETHILVPNLSELMCKSNLFIGAGGITTWERICLGLPSIIVTTGKNQEHNSKALDKKGYQQYLGDARLVTETKISNTIMRTLNSPDMLIKQSNLCRALVDANGAERVSKLILEIIK